MENTERTPEIEFTNPNDGDHVIDAESGGEDDTWQVPDEPELPAAEAEEDADAKQDPETAEDDTGEDEPAEEETTEFDPQNWDGNWDSLPADVKTYVDPVRKIMERGMHQKFQELAQLRKEYEGKLEGLKGKPSDDGQSDDGLPPRPGVDATIDEWVAYSHKLADATAEKRVKEVMQQIEPKLNQLTQTQEQTEITRRCEGIEKRNDYTPEIGARMAELVQSKPQVWGNAVKSDEAIGELFELAKYQVSASTQAKTTAKRKAQASSRSVNRPRERGQAKEATPASKYDPAGTFSQVFESIGKEVVEEMGLRY